MAKLFENNYRTNPYVYGMVNVLSSFCRDYLGYGNVGELIVRMMEAGSDEK